MSIDILEKIILEIISKRPQTKAEFDHARQKICAQMKMTQPPNYDLLSVYQNLIKKKRAKKDEKILYFLRKAQIRTLSGIAIVTSLTKPYKCPGKCIYCPKEAKMPKSYLSNEPAAARALGLKFDPYKQMRRRIEMLEQNGHPTDKIEFIVKGGTWNAYPLNYQYWFILRSFQACNELRQQPSSPPFTKGGTTSNISPLKKGGYRGDIGRQTIKKLQKELEKEQRKNEKAKHRIIGLTLETRPDFITPKTIYHMRQQGCTRIELGLQVPDDKILKLVSRGHTVQQFKDAMLLLRQAGFKIDLHFMPDLPGSTPKHDVEMYKKLFSDPGLKPDMVKIYPCTVIKNSPLYKLYKSGKYRPYEDKKLFEAIIKMKLATPRWCRISRLIRDIPETDIIAGNKITNLREELKKEMKKRGLKCQCLRCREIGHSLPLNKGEIKRGWKPKLFVDKYQTTDGREYFLSFEDKKREVVFAFLRLRLPSLSFPRKRESRNRNGVYTLLSQLHDCAFIRELHTYGKLVNIGKNEKNASQHKGLGKKLMQEAEKIAKKNKYTKIAVIAGVGVREYYRKLGYWLKNTYMVKELNKE